MGARLVSLALLDDCTIETMKQFNPARPNPLRDNNDAYLFSRHGAFLKFAPLGCRGRIFLGLRHKMLLLGEQKEVT